MLTAITGAVLVNRHEETRQGAQAGLPRRVQLHQLQPRRDRGREAVELEGEVHGVRPRRFPAVLGHSEDNASSELPGVRSREPGLCKGDSLGATGEGPPWSPAPTVLL